MNRGRPLSDDTWSPIKDRVALAGALLDCKWDLPVAFERQGDQVIGTFTLKVAADLHDMSITDAQRDIALGMKMFILGLVDKAKAHP